MIRALYFAGFVMAFGQAVFARSVDARLVVQDAVAPEARMPADQRPTGAEFKPRVSLTAAEEERAADLEGQLRCPVCRSQSIRQSRSFMAEDMKRRLRELIAEGRTDQQIREYFVGRYGDWILLTPPKRGFDLIAYVVPLLVVVLGAAGLVVAARRWRRGHIRMIPEPPPPSLYLTRLEHELKEME